MGSSIAASVAVSDIAAISALGTLLAADTSEMLAPEVVACTSDSCIIALITLHACNSPLDYYTHAVNIIFTKSISKAKILYLQK
ncbi:hypothetical protein, partial [Klebsiella pneumoniae]|uniref:hypothetical protein n=1 Tax=Klebsiella pneumoniae TaxID=573 RepID=UPI001CC1E816